MNADFLSQVYFDNTLRQYASCLGILLFGFLLKRLIALLISKQTFRFFRHFAQNRFSEEFVQLLRKPFEQLITVLLIYAAFYQLNFPASWRVGSAEKIGLRWGIEAVFEIALTIVVCRLLLRTADFVAFVFSHREDDKVNVDLVSFVKELSKILLVVIAFFMVLAQTFEVNILTLITSLGIGGLAVALAAQDTIANLFGSFIIYLDRPFQVGDLVEIGEVKGEVERVGFRTTKVRTYDRSLLTVPNKKMVDSALNNISRSSERRVKFALQLTYDSDSKAIYGLIDDIKKIIAQNPDTTDEMTVHFTDFDKSSLDITVIYFVRSVSYEKVLQVKEAINFPIMQAVEQRGCRFAYPTQTVFLEKAD